MAKSWEKNILTIVLRYVLKLQCYYQFIGYKGFVHVKTLDRLLFSVLHLWVLEAIHEVLPISLF